MSKRAPKSERPRAEEIRLVYERLSALRRAPRNAKKHDEKGIGASMSRFGFTIPILVEDSTNTIAAGHGRLDELLRRHGLGQPPPRRIKLAEDGEWLVPTLRGVDLESASEVEAYLLADNRLTENGGYDDGALGAILRDIAALPAGLAGTGFDEAALNRILAPKGENDAGREWTGMPECESEDQTAWGSVKVNFASASAMEAFAALVGEVVTPSTRSIWYPRAEIGRYADKAYEEPGDDA